MKSRFLPVLVMALSAAVCVKAETAADAATNQPQPGVTYPWQQTPTAETSPAPLRPSESPAPLTEAHSARRFIVGTRLTQATLVTPHKKYFRGKLDTLDVDQDYAPTKVFAAWYFLPNWGVEVTWDQLRAAAFNEPDTDHGESVSDGDFVITCPMATLQWRYTESETWVPFVGVGAAMVKSDFDHAPWWHYGYNGLQHWIDAGKPLVPYKGGMRTFDTKDTTAFVAAAGCDYRFRDRWSAGIYGRYMPVDIETHWTNKGQNKGDKKVPMDNYVLGLSVSYGF